METVVTKTYQGAQTRLLLPKLKDVAGVIGDNNSTRLCFKLPKPYATGWVKYIEFDCEVMREDGPIKPTYFLEADDSFLIPSEITESNLGKEVGYNLKFVSTDGTVTEKSELATLYFRGSSNGVQTSVEPSTDILSALYASAHCAVTYQDSTTDSGYTGTVPSLTFTPLDPTGEIDTVSLNVPFLDESGHILKRFIDKQITVEVFHIASPNDLTSSVCSDAQVPDIAVVDNASAQGESYYMDLYMLTGNDPSVADNWYLVHTDNPIFKNVQVQNDLTVTGDTQVDDLEVVSSMTIDVDGTVTFSATYDGTTKTADSSLVLEGLKDKVLITNEDGKVIQSLTTTDELAQLTGIQSNVQQQIDETPRLIVPAPGINSSMFFSGMGSLPVASSVTKNDYAFVIITTTDSKNQVILFRSNGSSWVQSNTFFTKAQWGNINIGSVGTTDGTHNSETTISFDQQNGGVYYIPLPTTISFTTLNVSGNAVFGTAGADPQNTVTINGVLQANNINPRTGNAVEIGGELNIDGDTAITGDLEVGTAGTPKNIHVTGTSQLDGDITAGADIDATGTLSVDTVTAHTPNGDIAVGSSIELSNEKSITVDTIVTDVISSRSNGANDPVTIADSLTVTGNIQQTENNTTTSLKSTSIEGTLGVSSQATLGSLSVTGTSSLNNGADVTGTLKADVIQSHTNDNNVVINDSLDVSQDLSVTNDVTLSKQSASSILHTDANKNIDSTIIGSQNQILTVTDDNKTIGWQTPAGPLENSLGVASRGALYGEQQRAITAENTKVDKLTDAGLYAYTHNGSSQNHLPIAEGSTGSTIAQRDTNGRLTIVGAADSGGENQAITKTQLTNGLNTKVSKDFSSSLFYGASISEDSGASGVTIDFNIKDTNTGSTDAVQLVLPVADNQTAGVATSSQIAQIEQNTADIASLQGKSTRYAISVDVTQYQTPEALQTKLTEEWWVASGHTLPVTPGSEPDDYTTLVNLFSPSEPNNHEYTWMDYQGSEKWIDRGASTVATATNESLGIVQGTPDNNTHTNDGNIFVDSDGTMEVLGWGRALARVSNLESTMPTKVARIDTTTQNTGFAYIHNGTNDDELEIAQGNIAGTIVQRDQSGDITTRQFHGTLDGNATTASSAAEFTNAQTVELTGDVTGSASSQAGWTVATTLANSGVTSGDYGPQSNPSPAHNGTFTVPSFSVDAKGRITSATDRTVTLPDTQAKVPAGTSGQFVMASGTAGTLDYYDIETTGTGNAVTSVSVDTANDKVTVNKGTTFVDSVSQTSSAGYVSNVSKNGATLEVTRTAIPNVAVTGGTATAGKYVSGIATNGHGITVSQENLPVLSETDTGSGNIVTDIAVSGHAISWTKGKFLGADIPDPADEQTSVVGQALIVNSTGDGYVFGEAGKVDDVQVNGTSVVSNKIANITLPTIGDGTLTINSAGGTTLGTFSADQETDSTITLPMGAVQYNNVSATFATYTPDATETGVGLDAYTYRADIALTGITSSSSASVTFSPEQASSGQYASVCRSENGHLYLYASSNVGTITIPTIVVGMDYSDITIDSTPTLGSTNAVSSGGTYTAIQNARIGLCRKYSGSATIATGSWASSGVTAYPYKADISITGITADDYAQVSFASAEASSGNYDSGCDTLVDVVRIYAKAVPSGSITVTYMVIQDVS